MTTKQNEIKRFDNFLTALVGILKDYVSTKDGQWSIKGFIDIYKNVYTISSDTKIVSKILEIHIFPKVLELAEQFGYKVLLAEHQNWYPDLTIISNKNENIKFALDIKTTYRRKNRIARFTLGSHGSYFKNRDKDKNIQFPYSHYLGHYCLGIIYTRTDFTKDLDDIDVIQVEELDKKSDLISQIGEREITRVDKLRSITSVIKDFDFFAAPKWKIASDSRGSGNTANIGSIKDIDDLKAGNGVFSNLGEEWFDEYWINYGLVSMVKEGKAIPVTNIWDFLEFKGRIDLFEKVVAKGAKKRKK